MMRPQRRRIVLICPKLKAKKPMELFTDETVEIPFTLQNGDNGVEGLKSVWYVFGPKLAGLAKSWNFRVICHKVYRDEDNLQQNNEAPTVQRTFVLPTNTQSSLLSPLKGQNEQQQHAGEVGRRGTQQMATLVPMFSQEVATLLGPEQSVICYPRVLMTFFRLLDRFLRSASIQVE